VIAHADVQKPPALHQLRPRPGYYFGVRTHKDGSFAGWYYIPCNGRCRAFKVGPPLTSVLAPEPKIQPCIVSHTKPCSATIRTLLPNGQYRYHRVIVRVGSGTVGFVSSLKLARRR
jgi:hypothetical protein